jgi:hypothetical protein
MAFEPIIDENTFTAAQSALRRFKTDQELLACLRSLLAKEGWLGRRLINRERHFPCADAYAKRFGGLKKAYELVPARIGLSGISRCFGVSGNCGVNWSRSCGRFLAMSYLLGRNASTTVPGYASAMVLLFRSWSVIQ